VLATGGNRVAAEFSGISTRPIKFTVLVANGTLAALAGMLCAGRLSSGRYRWGTGDELSAIAATILGGTSLAQSRGSVIGALVGSLLIGLINSGLILAGLETSQQEIVLARSPPIRRAPRPCRRSSASANPARLPRRARDGRAPPTPGAPLSALAPRHVRRQSTGAEHRPAAPALRVRPADQRPNIEHFVHPLDNAPQTPILRLCQVR